VLIYLDVNSIFSSAIYFNGYTRTKVGIMGKQKTGYKMVKYGIYNFIKNITPK